MSQGRTLWVSLDGEYQIVEYYGDEGTAYLLVHRGRIVAEFNDYVRALTYFHEEFCI